MVIKGIVNMENKQYSVEESIELITRGISEAIGLDEIKEKGVEENHIIYINFELIEYEAFYGFETSEYVATGLGFGAIPHHATVESMIRLYEELKPDKNGNYPLISCPQLNTKALIPYGLELNGKKQIICGALILPVDYMNPYDDPTGKLRKTKNTISIHWYSKSWMNRRTVLRSKLTKPFHRLFGNDCFRWLKK